MSTNSTRASWDPSSQKGRQCAGPLASTNASSRARLKQAAARSTAPLANSSAGRVGSSGSLIKGIQRGDAARPALTSASSASVTPQITAPARPARSSLGSRAAQPMSSPAAGVAGIQ